MRNLYLLSLFYVLNVFSQRTEFSNHEIEFFVNGKLTQIKKIEALLVIKSDTIFGEFKNDKLIFPIVEENPILKLKINNISISSVNEIEKNFINTNSKFLFGQVKKFKKLKTLAAQNETLETDKDWEIDSSSFYVTNSNYLVKVKNWKNLKKLIFVIINTVNRGNGSIVTIQEEVIK